MVVGTGSATWQAMLARDSQRQAEDAKQQLAQRYRIAKESIDTYLLRISQDEQLDHPSFRPLRQRLIEAALPYYDQLHKLSPTDDLPRSARAEALNQLGRVQHELGQFNESRSAYEEAAKLFDQLAAELRAELADEQPESKKAHIQWALSEQVLVDMHAQLKSKPDNVLTHRQKSE